MATYIWDETLSVGNDTLDAQHKQLFDLLNRLDDTVGNSEKSFDALEIIGELEKYIEEHFSEEEKILRKVSYDRYTFHKSRHDYFNEKVSVLKNDIASGRTVSAMDLVCFLARWLKDHIMNDDIDYKTSIEEV